jgi:hypothetical protein
MPRGPSESAWARVRQQPLREWLQSRIVRPVRIEHEEGAQRCTRDRTAVVPSRARSCRQASSPRGVRSVGCTRCRSSSSTCTICSSVLVRPADPDGHQRRRGRRRGAVDRAPVLAPARRTRRALPRRPGTKNTGGRAPFGCTGMIVDARRADAAATVPRADARLGPRRARRRARRGRTRVRSFRSRIALSECPPRSKNASSRPIGLTPSTSSQSGTSRRAIGSVTASRGGSRAAAGVGSGSASRRAPIEFAAGVER